LPAAEVRRRMVHLRHLKAENCFAYQSSFLSSSDWFCSLLKDAALPARFAKKASGAIVSVGNTLLKFSPLA